jgi:signal transduction histidine kinase
LDAGSGVPDALRGRIFDPFVTTRAEGSGLGLAIAHRLAASMSGSVELASTGPSGSVFRVTLPRAPIDFDVAADLRGATPAAEVPGSALGVE